MIVSENQIKKNTYIVTKNIDIELSFDIHAGSRMKVTKFKGNELTLKFEPKDSGIDVSAKQCLDTNIKYDKKSLKQLKVALQLWVDEPEKFKFRNNSEGFGKHWWHEDGKICEYSYLKSLGYFYSKKETEDKISELEYQLNRFESGKDDKYFYKLVEINKFTLSVNKFNKHLECVK